MPDKAKPFQAMEPISGTPVSAATGVAALALNFALQYHDFTTVQDGALYQQYKLEGRNMRVLHLNDVFETAIRMEAHLLGASERIVNLVVDAIATAVEDEPEPDTGTGGGDV